MESRVSEISDFEKQINEKCERLGELEVRVQLERGVFSGKNKNYVQAWLRRRELEGDEAQTESANELARAAAASARDAADAARDQAEAAQQANSLAESANRLAEAANDKASTANVIATLALIAAVTAIAISAIGLFVLG